MGELLRSAYETEASLDVMEYGRRLSLTRRCPAHIFESANRRSADFRGCDGRVNPSASFSAFATPGRGPLPEGRQRVVNGQSWVSLHKITDLTQLITDVTHKMKGTDSLES